MKKFILNIVFVLYSVCCFSWGNDVLIGPMPGAKTSLVATASGMLYCTLPTNVTSVGGIHIFQSSDFGATWTSHSNPAPGAFVKKSKLVVTGTDSVYCAYQIDSAVFFYSLAASIVTPFTSMLVEDFDIAASPNSNSIYIYCDNYGTNDINRYSSSDGGYTWTGSTALVATNSGRPRIYMTGSRLILTYLNPLLADTNTSIIRGAFYDEAGPGQINPGTFQNLVAAGINRDQFAPVIINGNVWFLFTEGTTSKTIKMKLSTDNGATYGAETIIAGNPNVNAHCFDAIHFIDVTGNGVRLVYYSDSSSADKKMQLISATSLSPAVFSAPESFNDFSPICNNKNTYPSVARIGTDVGVIFIEDDGTNTSLYFDLRSAFVGINEISISDELKIYPNPVNSIINIKFNSEKEKLVIVSDISGRIVQEISITSKEVQADLSKLQSGIYFIGFKNKSGIRFIKN